MPIGRLVPLYTLEMMQNNRAKISCSQLTRFLTMSAPVMQNFEITFGAFFCPYIALDDYFVKSTARGNIGNNYDYIALHANEFFDPATPQADRHHPIEKTVSFLTSESLRPGSLIDHLQYKIFQDIDKSKWSLKMAGISEKSVDIWPELNNAYMLGLHPIDDEQTDAYWPDRSSGNEQFATLYTDDRGAITYDVPLVIAFVLNSPFFDGTQERADVAGILDAIDRTYIDKSSVTYSQAIRDEEIQSFEDSRLGAIAKNIWQDYKSDYDSAHRKYFGGQTQTMAWMNIVSWYTTRLIQVTHYDFSANVTRWLVYQRIYSDYFLPDEYVDCERYRAMIGAAYQHANLGNATLKSSFTAGNVAQGNSWLKNNANDPVTWYAPYLASGECMPVLWDMNQFTALKSKDDKGDPTAIGSSVEQNFYQRQLARFKGLVRRMGFDVQNNLDTIYGGHVTDETLRKSQVIGFKKFDVSIGDVAKTSSDGIDKNLGDFAGYAVSRDSMGAFDWTANQNGMLMICAYIRPKYTAIVNSIPRDMLKSDYFDYLLPQFGGVGYQDVTYRQLVPNGNLLHDNAVFGKQEIYAEYMSVDNECSGRMATDCKHYNMDRFIPEDIASLTDPKNLSFLYMTDADDLNRCFVDKENDPCLISAFFQGNVTRQLPSTIRVEY